MFWPFDAGRMIKENYDKRDDNPDYKCVVDVLKDCNFFDVKRTIVDVGCGPSPHLGYRLSQKLEDGSIEFIDSNYTTLYVHSSVYGFISSSEDKIKYTWNVSDVHKDKYVLKAKSLIIHRILPRLSDQNGLILPRKLNQVKRVLGDILSSDPYNLSIFHWHKNADLIYRALDSFGIEFDFHEKIGSADFTPVKGSLFVIDHIK